MQTRKIIGVVTLSVVAFVFMLCLAVPSLITGILINGRARPFTIYPASDYGLTAEDILLRTDDGIDLRAYRVEPEKPRGRVILLSGIDSPSVTAFWGYARMFAQWGYGSVLLEMRAHGESGGDKITLGYQEVLDVKAAVEYLSAEDGPTVLPVVVMGTSMGGAVALNAAGVIPEIDGVISQSAYSSWEDNLKDLLCAYGVPRWMGEIQKRILQGYLRLRYGSAAPHRSPLNSLSALAERPVLLIHSRGDSQVLFDNFLRMKEILGPLGRTYTVEGDFHFITASDEIFDDPRLDIEYSSVLRDFLDSLVVGN